MMKKENTIGLQIAYFRKLNCLTQEDLADKLGVSTQAVSKWEQQINYPDITLLPSLAKLFSISIDELFNYKSEKEVIYSLVHNVPWNDDNKVRVAVYCGKKLTNQVELVCNEGINVINFHFDDYNIYNPYTLNGVCKVNVSKL